MPDLGCEQDAEVGFIPFLRLLHIVHAGVKACIVAKEKDVFHVSVMTNSMDVMLYVV
jgi:hypothetical protein